MPEINLKGVEFEVTNYGISFLPPGVISVTESDKLLLWAKERGFFLYLNDYIKDQYIVSRNRISLIM